MKTLTRIFLVVGAAALSTAAFAQETSTVKDLLNAGATLVPGEELPELLVGHTWRSTYGTVGAMKFEADRTFSGNVKMPEQYDHATEAGVFGDWSIGGGALCMEWKHAGGRNLKEFCRVWYRLGDKFFAGGAPTNPGSRVWRQERVD